MKARKLLSVFSAAILVLSLGACSQSEKTTENGDGEGKKEFNILITTNKEGLALQNRVWQAAAERADELGIKWTYSNFKEADPAVEAEVAEQAITQQVDGVLWAPIDDEGSRQSVQSMLDAGIKVVSYIDPISIDDVVYVGSNNVDGAGSGLVAKEMCEALGGEGKVVYIKGTDGFITQETRDKAFKEVIAEYPGIEVIFEQHGNWDMETGGNLMDDAMIKYPNAGDIDAVFCHNDQMALGAMEVIKTAGRDDEGIKIFGIDGEGAFLEAITAGEATATAFQNAEHIGVTAVETLYRILNGEDVGDSVDVDWILANEESTQELLERWDESAGMYTIPDDYKDLSLGK